MKLEFTKRIRHWRLQTGHSKIGRPIWIIEDPHDYLTMLLQHGAAHTNKIFNIKRRYA